MARSSGQALRRYSINRRFTKPTNNWNKSLAGVIVGKALYEGRFTITEGQAALDLR